MWLKKKGNMQFGIGNRTHYGYRELCGVRKYIGRSSPVIINFQSYLSILAPLSLSLDEERECGGSGIMENHRIVRRWKSWGNRNQNWGYMCGGACIHILVCGVAPVN